jgi:hypothetical protein
MSQSTVARAANDPDLQQRVIAAVYSEAIGNPALHDTQYAVAVRNGYGNMIGMYWAVADAVDAEYEAGILSGRGAPGHDADVVTDGAITSAVVANWPPDLVTNPQPVVIP